MKINNNELLLRVLNVSLRACEEKCEPLAKTSFEELDKSYSHSGTFGRINNNGEIITNTEYNKHKHLYRKSMLAITNMLKNEINTKYLWRGRSQDKLNFGMAKLRDSIGHLVYMNPFEQFTILELKAINKVPRRDLLSFSGKKMRLGNRAFYYACFVDLDVQENIEYTDNCLVVYRNGVVSTLPTVGNAEGEQYLPFTKDNSEQQIVRQAHNFKSATPELMQKIAHFLGIIENNVTMPMQSKTILQKIYTFLKKLV